MIPKHFNEVKFFIYKNGDSVKSNSPYFDRQIVVTDTNKLIYKKVKIMPAQYFEENNICWGKIVLVHKPFVICILDNNTIAVHNLNTSERVIVSIPEYLKLYPDRNGVLSIDTVVYHNCAISKQIIIVFEYLSSSKTLIQAKFYTNHKIKDNFIIFISDITEYESDIDAIMNQISNIITYDIDKKVYEYEYFKPTVQHTALYRS